MMSQYWVAVLAVWLPPSQPSPQGGGGSQCSPSPCGPGAECQAQGVRNAICYCPTGFTGDPHSGCTPDRGSSSHFGSSSGGFSGSSSGSFGSSSGSFGSSSGSFGSSGFGSEPSCNRLSDCQFNRQCQGTPGRCVDPCTNNVETGRPPCGRGADCKATRYKAICSCPKTHTGDPFVSCRPFTPEDLCRPNPCGPNAFCKPGTDNLTGEDRPVCLCEEGYRGNGVTGCTRGECTSLQHNTCPDNRACYDSTCKDPCSPTFCGGSPCCNPTAACRGVQHLAECSCPPGTEGEPRAGLGGTCRRSTGSNNGGSSVGGGQHRVGSVQGAGVSSGSLCQPSPCGQDALCNVGSDITRTARPVCTCPRGYTGNALVSCTRGECFHDDECPNHLACFDYQCKDPCHGPDTSCGNNADCRVKDHGPICSCPSGYRGDPLSGCFPRTSRRG